MAPVVGLVGLGLFQRGFPLVGTAVTLYLAFEGLITLILTNVNITVKASHYCSLQQRDLELES